ncbi:hypothetical protein K1719_023094 [Acacia pycnantha]|nr:hypothetical protein K1719_023094 [Acacia pycnantha]
MNPSHYCVGFLVLLAVASSSCEAVIITCDQVSTNLIPCDDYLTSATGSKPPPECCILVKRLVAAMETPEERKAGCVCIKRYAQSRSINPRHAHDLPHICHIRMPFEIAPDLDCNKIGYCGVQY